ncbi:hypothetical protein RDI58_024617 [Solanum bulbocastanum]|uniref:Uncharacterized protein n=1 Tax=Solanum bulbocastanum TaxID=147425 RepID=A0AAN8SYK8_SOLBU
MHVGVLTLSSYLIYNVLNLIHGRMFLRGRCCNTSTLRKARKGSSEQLTSSKMDHGIFHKALDGP